MAEHCGWAGAASVQRSAGGTRQVQHRDAVFVEGLPGDGEGAGWLIWDTLPLHLVPVRLHSGGHHPAAGGNSGFCHDSKGVHNSLSHGLSTTSSCRGEGPLVMAGLIMAGRRHLRHLRCPQQGIQAHQMGLVSSTLPHPASAATARLAPTGSSSCAVRRAHM